VEVRPFKPNYIKNRGKNFDKNGTAAGPKSKKARTEIKGAIKTVADVPVALEKAKKKKRGAGKDTEASGRKVPGVSSETGLSRVSEAPHKAKKPTRKRQHG